MSNTLLLDLNGWDLVLDATGNIALASEPYSVAQDVASAIRTFAGEVWYNVTLGVPYWAQILGKRPPLQLLKSQFVAAALTVPGVTAATCFISSVSGRQVEGQVIVTFANPPPTPAPNTNLGRAVIYFVGDNGGVVTFVGDNGGVLEFFGQG